MKTLYRWPSQSFLFLALLCGFTSNIARSELESNEEDSPQIDAVTFTVKVLARSNSNRVYLLEDPSLHQPYVGRILLLKTKLESEPTKSIPVMAIRVLKVYPDTKMIAGKSVKKYGTTSILGDNLNYTAIEKVSDIIPPAPTPNDRDDLIEIEAEKNKLHIESPAGATLPPGGNLVREPSAAPAPPAPVPEPTPPLHSEPATEGDLEEIDSGSEGKKVVEIPNLDPYRNWISVGFGVLRNYSPPSAVTPPLTTTLLTSGNIRYGFSLLQRVLFKTGKIQDAFVLEAGFYGSQVVGATSDTYTILTLIPTLRYNLALSERFAFFIYGGVTYSLVLSYSNAVDPVFKALNSLLPAAGGGLLFQIGPGWYIRLDGGLESVTGNIVLRF